MAVRIRKDGRIFCAAMFPAEPGDTYLDDNIHYMLSSESKVLVTEPHERHQINGEWWWKGNVPEGIVIDPFYTDNKSNINIKSIKQIYIPRPTRIEDDLSGSIQRDMGAVSVIIEKGNIR